MGPSGIKINMLHALFGTHGIWDMEKAMQQSGSAWCSIRKYTKTWKFPLWGT